MSSGWKQELSELIDAYALNKDELEAYKKLCDSENKQIKSIMAANNQDSFPTEKYVAKYITTKRETLNEEKLLQLFEETYPSIYMDLGIIKTKKYIDYDALEKAIYNNQLPAGAEGDIAKAKEVKEVVQLRLSKVKKKKGEE